MANNEEIKNWWEKLEVKVKGGTTDGKPNTREARKQIQDIRNKMERREREERKLNLIIKGVKLDKRNEKLEREKEKFLKGSIKTEAEIETTRVISEEKMITSKI